MPVPPNVQEINLISLTFVVREMLLSGESQKILAYIQFL
jgi:hypothetical protein